MTATHGGARGGVGRLTARQRRGMARMERARETDPDLYLHYRAMIDFDCPFTEQDLAVQAVRRVMADCVQRGLASIKRYDESGEPVFVLSDEGRAAVADETLRPPEPLGCGRWRLSTSGPLVFTPRWVVT